MSFKYTTGPATNSKHPDRYAEGAPRTVDWAHGAWVRAGERDLVDLTSGLGAVILGHAHVEVDDAVRDQLDNGVSFPLPTALEEEVAEALVRHLGWGEQVRFSKNGRDAVVAAVRLARAVTGRDGVLYCDYHGSDDLFLAYPPWNAGVTPSWSRKVPRCELLDMNLSEAACVVLEPVSSNAPEERHDEELVAWIREQCDRAGCLLILDEMVSFGRMPGGSGMVSQGIVPDLWVGGKCIANGLPLTAVVGPRKHMHRFGVDVFHSMTHAGEALSLAAAKATLWVLAARDVPGEIGLLGKEIIRLFEEAVRPVRYAYPQRLLFDLTRDELGILLDHGVLCQGFANLTLAHAEDPDARRTILDAFRAVLS